ncbi:MAG: hypothetical protein AABZ64_06375 [Nitrospinota bacterium]
MLEWVHIIFTAPYFGGFLEIAMSILQARKKRPAILFKDEGENHAFEAGLVWLHIKVEMRKPYPWEFPLIERCWADAIIYGNNRKHTCSLRWQTRAPVCGGEDQITLEYGIPRLIPIAVRYTGDREDFKEKYGHRVAVITDDLFLLHNSPKAVKLSPGEYTSEITLHSGSYKWPTQKYTLSVPTPDSDLFTLRTQP